MDIQLPQIIFQIINFGVVLGALSYLLYKPILKILDDRAQRVEDAQIAAQHAVAQGEHAEELKKTVRQKADKEAAKVMEEAVKAAAVKKAQLLDQAKAEALAEVERLRTAWNEEKKQSLQNMKSDFMNSVISASEKVVGTSLDSKAHAKLIEQEWSNLLKSL
ncbi:MAG: ATP synthase F0 subunit B [bacterium]|nr:ATP synthase F0 subunit B [bacterium]